MIIGITGTIAAGKGTIVEILEKQGYTHFSARTFLSAECEKRGLEPHRDNLKNVANDLRETQGPDIVIRSLYEMAKIHDGNVVIESIRSLGEIDFLTTQQNFFLIGVDADIKTRYERAVERKSQTDDITFEKFVAQNEAENSGSSPFEQNILGCMMRADFLLNNDGEKEELEKHVQEILNAISQKLL